MTREELEAALDVRGRRHDGEMYGCVACYRNEPCPDRTILDAARKQLALMPEKCETCGGSGERQIEDFPEFTTECHTCHSSGKVYPQETVEKIAKALSDGPYSLHQRAVAVLDALGESE